MSKKKQAKKKHPRLKRLSVYPLTMEQAITAFMKVDPVRVDKKMEQQGIFPPSRRKK